MSGMSERLARISGDDPRRELFYSQRRRLSIKAFRGEIASFTQSDDAWVAARVVDERRLGTAYTEELSDASIETTIARATENATLSGRDDGNVLYASSGTEEFDGRRGSLTTLSVDAKKELALEGERAARAVDARIVNVPYCYYMEEKGEAAIANGYGLRKAGASGSCGFLVSVIARDGDETQIGSEYVVAPDPTSLDVASAAGTAAARALAKFGAREIDSGAYRIVFDRATASELLGALLASPSSPFYGENIQKGRSLLAGKAGERIGSPLVTIVDDPRRGLDPVAFDGDGVATGRVVLVDEGVFTTVVHNLYSAAREGAESTGHASRTRGGVGTSLHHPGLENGTGSLEDLLEQMGAGILVTEMAGLHAGLNAVTGDFSLSAQGFFVRDGAREFPVRNIVVAGNLLELTERLLGKAADRRDDSRGGIDSPSILIEQLSVSGK